jgi:hypothetical protein
MSQVPLVCDKHTCVYICVNRFKRMNLIWGPINSYKIELIPELNNFVLSRLTFFPFLTNSFEKWQFSTLYPHSYSRKKEFTIKRYKESFLIPINLCIMCLTPPCYFWVPFVKIHKDIYLADVCRRSKAPYFTFSIFSHMQWWTKNEKDEL